MKAFAPERLERGRLRYERIGIEHAAELEPLLLDPLVWHNLQAPDDPPPTWGQGLATELAHASVRVAFEMLELSELIAFTLPDNAASRRVMEKSGFAYADDIEHEGMPHVLYRRGPG